jgi:hypothetical protein
VVAVEFVVLFLFVFLEYWLFYFILIYLFLQKGAKVNRSKSKITKLCKCRDHLLKSKIMQMDAKSTRGKVKLQN